MAHFYGTMQGNRGEGARCGTAESGLTAHIRGWHIGINVSMSYNAKTGEDEAEVYVTSGSTGGSNGKFLGVFTKDRKLSEQEVEKRKLQIGQPRRVE